MTSKSNTKQRTALVTGATSGIGKAIALELNTKGYRTIALGRNRQMLDSMCQEAGIVPLVLDIRDSQSLGEALEHLEIDVLVNNAGTIPRPAPLAQMSQSEIDKTLHVNVTSTIAVTRLVLPGMLARGSGHLLFTGSIIGHTPYPNMAVYGASKAAIANFAAALRCEVASAGIRVTEIVPGRVETKLYKDVLTQDEINEMYSIFEPVQPESVAQMVSAVLAMPAHVDVTRFDILPTSQYVGGGGHAGKSRDSL